MIHLVCGPPCAGKTTHVERHARPGDLVIDLDALALALAPWSTPYDYPASVAGYASTAADAVLLAAIGSRDVCDVWLVRCLPDHDRRTRLAHHLGASVTALHASREECHDRARQAGRPPKSHRAIDAYFDSETGHQCTDRPVEADQQTGHQ